MTVNVKDPAGLLSPGVRSRDGLGGSVDALDTTGTSASKGGGGNTTT